MNLGKGERKEPQRRKTDGQIVLLLFFTLLVLSHCSLEDLNLSIKKWLKKSTLFEMPIVCSVCGEGDWSLMKIRLLSMCVFFLLAHQEQNVEVTLRD